MVLDTETIGLTDRVVYDWSWIVCSSDARRILSERSIVVEQVYCDARRMRRAHLADKVLAVYPRMLADGHTQLESWQVARQRFNADLTCHDVRAIWAYNAPFDLGALRDTCGEFEGHRRLFSGLRVPILDLWSNACWHLCRSRRFQEWARQHGYVSARGNVQTSADIMVRYVTGRDYAHEHTGLADCYGELEILRAVLARKRAIVRHPVAHPWKWAQC